MCSRSCSKIKIQVEHAIKYCYKFRTLLGKRNWHFQHVIRRKGDIWKRVRARGGKASFPTLTQSF